MDEYPESELDCAEHGHEELRLTVPPRRELADAPLDDEAETVEERAAVLEARRDVAAANVIPHDEVKERWRGLSGCDSHGVGVPSGRTW